MNKKDKDNNNKISINDFRYKADILIFLYKNKFLSQRDISKRTGYSLGMVNKILKILIEESYLDENYNITEKAKSLLKENKPKRAIILAAGFGMRMVPINTVSPKALMKVHGEILIERMINKLNEVGVDEIYVVVGFMKEEFDYLIDKFNVKLIVNPFYAIKNNLYSLYLLKDYLVDSYIIPSDIYISKNLFSETELYSWYMVSHTFSNESVVKVNRKNELSVIDGDDIAGNRMIGVSFLKEKEAEIVKERLEKYSNLYRYEHSFWEETLYDEKKKKFILYAKLISKEDVYEINTYEELRTLDLDSDTLKSDAIEKIADIFNVKSMDIKNIKILKKGMTNRSFLFTCKDKKYIMRIPGEGTDKLIDRKKEADVYNAIKGKGLCDDPIYLNPKNGYKITKYLEGVRNCDKRNIDDLKCCMKKLREFHNMPLYVSYEFNIWKQIDFYESLWGNETSNFRDYDMTKKNVFSLKSYIDKSKKHIGLTHIDAVPDNFLFYKDKNGKEMLQLTDWEYSANQDKHVDIAMFCIYSMYNKKECDNLIDIYFENKCDEDTRTKIYCYIAMCGLLWSNWCEYKRTLGVEFSEYGMKQYRYAKDFYKYATKRIK